MSLLISQYIRDIHRILEQKDIESDEYNNAVLIAKAIEDMDRNNVLTSFEKEVLNYVSQGYSYREIASALGCAGRTVSTRFKTVTDRIAYIMGGEFTDIYLLHKFDDDIPNIKFKKFFEEN